MTALDGVNGTLCNAEQYQRSLPSQDNPIPLISCLTHGQTTGLTLTVETSFLSLISVIGIYTWIGWNFRWYRTNARHLDWRLFRGPFDIYMFSLLGFDIVQAVGGILNIRWAHDAIVTAGPYCTTQGLISQFGELGVAVITLIIAVHTFIVAMWGIGMEARGFPLFLVLLALSFSAAWVGIGAGLQAHKPYETPVPFWCWISPEFPGERLAGEYIWLWLALFASLSYILSFFWAGGRLSLDNNKWYKFKFHGVADKQKRAALGMVLYPVAYALVVLPLSIARWSLFTHKKVSSAATFFGISVFYLSGAINVLLLLIARSQLLLLTRPKVDDQPEKPATPQSHEVNGQPEIELTQLNGNAAHAAVSDNEHGPGPMVTGLTALPEAGSSNSTPLIV